MTSAEQGASNPHVRTARPVDILTICLVSGCAGQTFLLMPILLGTLADGRGYAPPLLGSIASATAVGGLITGLSSPLWLAHFPIRFTAVGLVLALVAGLLLTGFVAQSPAAAMLCMAIHGIAAGALYTLMFGAVSLYSKPERTLGWKLGTEALPGLMLLYVASAFVVPRYGTSGVIVAMALSSLILGIAAFFLPTTRAHVEKETVSPGNSAGLPMLLIAVAATFASWMGINAVWTFMERIGVDHGLSIATTGAVLTLGWLFASVGSLGAGALGNRFGGRKPFVISSALAVAALLGFLDPSALGFGIAANIYLIAASFSIVFAVALITRLTTQARFAGLGAVALQAAGVVGPMAGGLLYSDSGAGGICAFAGVSAMAGVGLYLLADRYSAGRMSGTIL